MAFVKALWLLLFETFGTLFYLLHAIITTFGPYAAAILPAGSLTLVPGPTGYVYQFNRYYLIVPYGVTTFYLSCRFRLHSDTAFTVGRLGGRIHLDDI